MRKYGNMVSSKESLTRSLAIRFATAVKPARLNVERMAVFKIEKVALRPSIF